MKKLLLYPLKGKLGKDEFDFLFFNDQLPTIVLHEKEPKVIAQDVVDYLKKFFDNLMLRGLVHAWDFVKPEEQTIKEWLISQLEKEGLPILIEIRIKHAFKSKKELVVSLGLNELGEAVEIEKDALRLLIEATQDFRIRKKEEVNRAFGWH